jgi:hypothetical protein
MPRKLSDVQVGELRGRYAAGESLLRLSEEYAVTERHCRRLVEGVEPPNADDVGSVEVTVQRFVAMVEARAGLDLRTEVVAQTTLQIARKLDRSNARSAAGLAARLIELVDDLLWQTREPDALDALQQRRLERQRLTTGSSSAYANSGANDSTTPTQ